MLEHVRAGEEADGGLRQEVEQTSAELNITISASSARDLFIIGSVRSC